MPPNSRLKQSSFQHEAVAVTKPAISRQLAWGAFAVLLAAAIPLIWPLLGPHLPQKHSNDDARGYFPKGCEWRLAPRSRGLDFWDVRRYEYRSGNDTVGWSEDQPSACRLQASVPAKNWKWPNASRSSMKCTRHHCVYSNIWYNNGAWYYVSDEEDGTGTLSVSRDVEFAPLTVRDTKKFVRHVDAQWVQGGTVMIDFLFFLHPTAIGHWLEHLLPLVSALREERKFSLHRVLILHLKRVHVFEWVRAALAAALDVAPGTNLPPIFMQREVDSVHQQIGVPLEGVRPSAWLCFERLLVVKDTYTDGGRVALTQEDAQAFRSRMYRLHDMQVPSQRHASGSAVQPSKPSITLLRKSSNRRILNERQLATMLGEFGDVHVEEFTETTPVATQLATMAKTSLLVSTHTSGLSNAVFLPPGAAVVELIQRNWVWPNLDLSFKVQTVALGDVHHWAWRATNRSQVAYLDARDEVRFGGEEWAGEKCDTDECTEAHTRVDLEVDIAAVRSLLKDRLPRVWSGATVQEAELPWPIVPQ